MSALDIVVVNFRTAPLVAQLVASLSEWAETREAMFLLLDNGSGDGSAEVLSGLGPRTRLTVLERNAGFAAAANIASAKGNARWLLFVNPDVTIATGTLDRLLKAAEAGPAVLGGRVAAGPRAHGPIRHTRPDGSLEVEWIAGSLLMVPRREFEAAGGFDPAYFMYLEDVDLCERLRATGLGCIALAGAAYAHSGGAAYEASGRDRVADWRASRRLYLGRHYGAPAALFYDLWTRLSDLANRVCSR